jgi:hypothetical protein
MWTITIFIISFLFPLLILSQNLDPSGLFHTKKFDANLLLLAPDNLMHNKTIYNKKDKLLDWQRDTLTQYYDRSTGLQLYVYRDQNQNLRPLTGTNGVYHLVGMKYEVSHANILGVMMSFGFKSISAEPDSLAILVSAGDDSTGLPVNPIYANTGFSTNDIDTNYNEAVFTTIYFNKPAEISGKFAISVQVWTQETGSDIVAVHSNTQGDANGEKTAFLSVVQEEGIASLDFENFSITMSDGNRPDFDLLIMPIIEVNITDISSHYNCPDFTFKGIAPNPANDEIKFYIDMHQAKTCGITIIDNNGKIVKEQTYNNLLPGENYPVIDLRGLTKGVYYYMITSGKSRISGKFIKL